MSNCTNSTRCTCTLQAKTTAPKKRQGMWALSAKVAAEHILSNNPNNFNSKETKHD